MSCLSLLFEVFLGNTEVDYLKYSNYNLSKASSELSSHRLNFEQNTTLCFYNVSKLQDTKLQDTNKSFFNTQLVVLFANTTGVKTFITICVWLYKITVVTGVIVL